MFFDLFCLFILLSKEGKKKVIAEKITTSTPFQAKIQTIQGHARFTSDPEPTVEVNGRKYTAPHILIATGGQPSVLSDAEVPGKTYSTVKANHLCV